MSSSTPHNANKSQRPNIVLILVDDMGFSDIGCFGSEISTPHLNELARNGVRNTQHYNCARCCPTRASLLTGLYPHQAGVGHMVQNRGSRAYQGYLRDDCVTIAEALRAGGYQTLMAGKWHVGGPYQSTAPETWEPGSAEHPMPLNRGFDRFFGTLEGAGSFFHPYTVMEGTAADGWRFWAGKQGQMQAQDFYYTDAISAKACDMIEDANQNEAPFFLYLAYTAPHWPLHARPEDIARYEGRYRAGWDALRTARHEELKGLGVLDKKWEIAARDENAAAWADAPDHDWEDLRMAVYAAQIDRMDQGVGQVMQKLKELGQFENTLILFMSDNGGCAEFLAEEGHANERYRYHTADGEPIRVGNIRTLQPGGADTFMSYDLPWAHASNSPFRLYKHWVHEGGIATPLIAHWPAGIPANAAGGGRIVHEPTHVVDMMATCLDVAGVGYPSEHKGNIIQPIEGESVAPLLRGERWTRERPIFWEHEGNRAVRLAEWKLVSKFPGEWELYHMDDDRTERHNLLERNQTKAADFMRQYTVWAQRCEVREWPL
ncbi:MAG: arylsulfatase [Caldilineaceae bacterium]|nr:arylsulfatase [Caldilineaceae bacterium]